jgi:hypothetical protein
MNSLHAFMTDSQERKADAESRFLLNLARMSGSNTNAVTPECILEFLAHVQNTSVEELQFIEEAYTTIVFEDDDFMTTHVKICSVEVNIHCNTNKF